MVDKINAGKNGNKKMDNKIKDIILMFPGQGSQSEGMGLEFLSKNERYYKYFNIASSIFGENLVDILINKGEKGSLIDMTQYCQVLIYSLSCALNDYLFSTCGMDADRVGAVLGHSLGDYSALYCSGAYEFEKGAEIVCLRGKLMASISNSGPDSDTVQPVKQMMMAAVIGSDLNTISDVVKDYKDSVFIANYNEYSQIVISGYAEELLKAGEEMKNRGAKRFLPLKVKIASHCPLMKTVSEKLEEYLDKDFTGFNDFKIDFFSSTSVEKISKDKIKDTLVNQIISPVWWVDSIETVIMAGIVSFIEVGPGKVLSGLVKRIASKMGREDIRVFNMDSLAEINILREYLQTK